MSWGASFSVSNARIDRMKIENLVPAPRTSFFARARTPAPPSNRGHVNAALKRCSIQKHAGRKVLAPRERLRTGEDARAYIQGSCPHVDGIA